MSRAERDWAANALSFVGASRPKLAELGFEVGKDLHNSVTDFVACGKAIYGAPADHFSGRKRHRCAEAVADKWVDASHLVGRKKRNGADLRTVHGGKARVAQTITRQFEVSLATAYRYCPPNVVSGAKYTDLCVYCEALRYLRLKSVRLAKIQGLDIPDLDEFVGQNEAAGPGRLAEQFLKENAESGDVAELLSAVAILTEHENLGVKLRGKMLGEYNLRFVAVFDYSSNVSLRSIRGESDEFYSAPALSLFGVMFVVPDGGGGHRKYYVDVFSHRKSHTSENAAASLHCALGCFVDNWDVGGAPREMSFYSDKGKHFASGEMAYEVLFRISADAARVSYTYHACYHGKTALDGHFARTKDRIAKIKVCKWPRTQEEVEKLVIDSYQNEDRIRATFVAGTHRRSGGRVKLIIPGISAVQHMERVTDPESNQDILAVEGKNLTVRTRPAGPDRAADTSDDEEDDGAQDAAKDAVALGKTRALCETLTNQKRNLLFYTRFLPSNSKSPCSSRVKAWGKRERGRMGGNGKKGGRKHGGPRGRKKRGRQEERKKVKRGDGKGGGEGIAQFCVNLRISGQKGGVARRRIKEAVPRIFVVLRTSGCKTSKRGAKKTRKRNRNNLEQKRKLGLIPEKPSPKTAIRTKPKGAKS